MIQDAQTLKEQSDSFDAIGSGLVLNYIPNKERAVAELVRVAKKNGTVAAYVWDYAGEMQWLRIFWDAAVALDPAVRELDESVRFPVCKPEPLAALCRAVGLHSVETRAIDVLTVFRDFDDYGSPFLGGPAPAPSYAMSLMEEKRAALREKICGSLPICADGSIHLMARAWGVRGVK